MGQLMDLTGQKFGRLTVIERFGHDKQRNVTWRCKCECGNEKIVSTSTLNSGSTKSCGCIKSENLIGKRFGKLTVIGRAENDKHKHIGWICKCECGNEKIVSTSSLNSGSTKSCGCIKNKDLTGKRFGRLTVLERAKTNTYGHGCWRCKCDCGNEKIVAINYLVTGNTKSCGCYQIEARKKRHGEASFNSIFRAYKQMASTRGLKFSLSKDEFKELILSNCYYCNKEPLQVMRNPNFNGDTVYNGLDRIDNSKGYTKDNVRSCCGQCNIAKSNYSEEEFFS
jgi:hypothetical protein